MKILSELSGGNMSANRLRIICSKMFSKKIHFPKELALFGFLVFDPFYGLKKIFILFFKTKF